MPDIKGKKINQLDDGKAVESPLFVLSDQDGKAYNMGAADLKTKLDSLVVDGETISVSVDLNTIINAGNYILNQTSFSNGSYQNAHYIPGVMLTSDVVLSVEVFSTGDVIQRLRWPFEGGESVRRLVLNNASWAHGKTWTKWEHWGGVYWIDGTPGGAFQEAGGMNVLITQGNYIVNIPYTSNSQLALLNLPKAPTPMTNEQGSVYVRVEGRNNYENNQQYIKQYATYVRNRGISASTTGAKDTEATFTRRFNIDTPTADNDPNNFFGPWYLDLPTLRNASLNGLTVSDQTLVAGTATIPALAFTPGVQKQNPVVKNSFNTDGTGLFFTNNAGVTYKLDMTAV